MDLRYLKRLLQIFDESDAMEITLEEEGSKIKISKNQKNNISLSGLGAAQLVNTKAELPSQAPSTQAIPSTETQIVAQEPTSSSDAHEVLSPIVGTFYRAPSPESPVFVEVGDRVQKGQVLCIVEAMKLMNEIESDVSGVVESILIENAQAVEFGQPLFKIKAD